MTRFRYLRNVVTLSLDEKKCLGCGMCTLVCPHQVFALDNGSASIQDRDACMECGACSMNCPAGAIQVRRGVGCATALINSALRRKDSGCCCIIDPEDSRAGGPKEKSACC